MKTIFKDSLGKRISEKLFNEIIFGQKIMFGDYQYDLISYKGVVIKKLINRIKEVENVPR